ISGHKTGRELPLFLTIRGLLHHRTKSKASDIARRPCRVQDWQRVAKKKRPASGAIAGLASSLLAYVRRLFAASLPTHVFLRDFLLVGAIVLAVGAGAAFLTGMNMVSLTVPEGSTTRMKSKPENQAPSSKPETQRLSPTGNHMRVTSVIGIEKA